MYHLYVFFNDESATIFNYPFSTTEDPTQTDLTDEQWVDLTMACIGDAPFTHEQVANWSREQQTAARWDLGGLIFDTVAILPADLEHSIEVIGDACFDQVGDDSSTYAAVETFNTVLKEFAVKLIDIGCNTDEELFDSYS